MQAKRLVGGLAAVLSTGAWCVTCLGARHAFPELLSRPLDWLWMGVFGTGCVVAALLACLGWGAFLLRMVLAASLGLLSLPVLLAGLGAAIGTVAWLGIIAAGLGIRLLKIIKVNTSLSGELVTLSATVGLGLLAKLTLILGLAGRLSRPWVLAVLALLTVALWSEVRAVVSYCARLVWRLASTRTARPLESLALALIALCFAGAFLWAIAPAVQYDSLVQHLGVPQYWVSAGKLVELPEFRLGTHWSHNAELLYALCLVLPGQPAPGLVNFAFGLMATALTYYIGTRLGSRRTGLLAACLFAASPLVSWQSGATYTDLMLTQLLLGSACAVLAWWQARESNWLLVAGMLGGLALGTKLNALLFIIPLGALVAAGAVARCSAARSPRPGLAATAWFAVGLALAAGPWLLIEWLRTGNPVFPFFNAVFKSPLWPPDNFPAFNWPTFGLGRSAIDLLRLPLDLTWRPGFFCEMQVDLFAGVTVTSIPFALPLMRPESRRFIFIIGLLVAASVLPWFLIGQYSRYLMPILPWLAVAAALNVEATADWGARLPARRVASVLAIALAIAWFSSTRWAYLSLQFYAPERLPFRIALGREDGEGFLNRTLLSYPAHRYLAGRAASDSIGVLSIANEYRLYVVPARIHDGVYSPVGQEALRTAWDGPGSLADYLAAHHIQYILVDTARLPVYWFDPGHMILSPDFLHGRCEIVFARHGAYVYRLLPPGARPQSRSPNLLTNGSFELVDSLGSPDGWTVVGSPELTRDGDIRDGKVAVRVSQQDYLFQLVPVQAQALYVAGAIMRACHEATFGWLQVLWLDEKMAQVGCDIMPVPAGPSWASAEMFATAPERAAFAQVHARAAPGSAVCFNVVTFQRVRGADD